MRSAILIALVVATTFCAASSAVVGRRHHKPGHRSYGYQQSGRGSYVYYPSKKGGVYPDLPEGPLAITINMDDMYYKSFIPGPECSRIYAQFLEGIQRFAEYYGIPKEKPGVDIDKIAERYPEFVDALIEWSEQLISMLDQWGNEDGKEKMKYLIDSLEAIKTHHDREQKRHDQDGGPYYRADV